MQTTMARRGCGRSGVIAKIRQDLFVVAGAGLCASGQLYRPGANNYLSHDHLSC